VNEITGRQFAAQLSTNLVLSECPGVPASQAPNATNANYTVATLAETVSNTGNDTLQGVTATIEGLPAGFTVTQKEPSGVDIAPGQAANLTLYAQVPEGATANGLLVVRDSSGRIISQRPVTLSAVSAQGVGITGFFAKAISANLVIIGIMLLVALAIVLMYARKQNAAQATQEESAKADAASKEIIIPLKTG
jgi:hypothetical protein